MSKALQRFVPDMPMHSETFQIFHYRDSKPVNTQVHYHDYYEVCCFLSGDIEYWVEGRTYRLKSGDILLINPSELHRHIVNKGNQTYERIVLWINKDYIKKMSGDISLLDCFAGENFDFLRHIKPSPVIRAEMTSRLLELSKEYYTDDFGSRLCANAIFVRFMIELNRIALHRKKENATESEQSSIVLKVLDYIGENYYKDLSLDTLAQKFYVSKYHLSHEFSNSVGTSIHRYILLKRLLAARQLILNGENAGTAAMKCGFKDYTSFFRAFKNEYGISPRMCYGKNGED